MAKQGILHDYDLYANAEPTAEGNACIVCDANPVRYQWSDYSGEAMCMRCGTPYQLKWGGKEREDEGAYPYLNLADKWVPHVREYWQEKERFTCFGWMLGPTPGMAEFLAWAKERHPEMFPAQETEGGDGE